MAQLPSQNLDQVWQSTMSEFSSVRTTIPIDKNQLRALLELMDEELETAEVSIIQALPSGDGKAWLITNPALGRQLMLDILLERKEVL